VRKMKNVDILFYGAKRLHVNTNEVSLLRLILIVDTKYSFHYLS